MSDVFSDAFRQMFVALNDFSVYQKVRKNHYSETSVRSFPSFQIGDERKNGVEFRCKFMNQCKIFAVFCLVAVFSLAAPKTRAHDYWFEADNFFPAENASVTFHLQLGSALKIEEERFYQPEKTLFFKLLSAAKVFDLHDKSEKDAVPVAKTQVGASGTYLLGMARTPVESVLEADKFDEYLREEGLENIIAERAKRGESQKFGYERYSRFIKSVVQVGDKRDETYRKLLGFKLEIQPLENPYRKKSGDSLKMRLLFGGKPLGKTVVFAHNRTNDQVFTEKYVTDARGNFNIKLSRQGLWLVRLVKMERCTQNCGENDWESWWGSLSFQIR